jgi:hypothetical protein
MFEKLLQLRDDLPGSVGGVILENLDDEAEYVNLPSKGYFFTGVYKNTTQIKVKKLSYIEEKLLSTPSYFDNETIIEEVLQNVILDKNFPIGELIEIDRNTILWWLRIGAFGGEYSLPYVCFKCKDKGKTKQQQLNWDLTSFTLPDYKADEQELKEKGFITITSGDVLFKVTNYGLQKEKDIVKFIDSLNLKVNTEHKITIKLLSIIKSITKDNVEFSDIKSIYQWLQDNKISFQTSRLLQNEFENINLNIETKQKFICSSCDHKEEVDFPMTKYFFGLNTPEYREHLIKVVNYLNFWGRIDYQSILRMPTHKRRHWCFLTEQNIKTLYNIKS